MVRKGCSPSGSQFQSEWFPRSAQPVSWTNTTSLGLPLDTAHREWLPPSPLAPRGQMARTAGGDDVEVSSNLRSSLHRWAAPSKELDLHVYEHWVGAGSRAGGPAGGQALQLPFCFL